MPQGIRNHLEQNARVQRITVPATVAIPQLMRMKTHSATCSGMVTTAGLVPFHEHEPQ